MAAAGRDEENGLVGTATKALSEISDKTQREASVFLSDSIDKVVAAQGYFDDSFDGGFTVLDNLVNAGLVSLAADGTEIGFIPIAKYDLIAPLIQKMFSSSLLDNEFIPGETGGMTTRMIVLLVTWEIQSKATSDLAPNCDDLRHQRSYP